VEVMRPFDFLLCRRDALAAPCQEAVLKTARFSTRGYFNIPNVAPVHFFCLRSFFIEIVSLLPEHLYALRTVIAVSTGRNAILRMIGVSNTRCHLRSGTKGKEWLHNQVPLIGTTITRNIYVGSILLQEFQ